jgi:hypothetical protein
MMKKSREKQLVIHCARTHMDEERIYKVRNLLEGRELDWDYILNHRAFYRITPLLFHNLKEIADEDAVPLFVMDALTAHYAFMFYRNMQIYSILRDILERFQNAGISVILLKGVALGETVYSDIDLRPPGDIDILVKKMDLQDAADILLKMGYNPAYPMERYRNHHHIPPYKKLDEELNESISIEIHHNIAPEPLMSRIRAEELWEDAQAVSISGIDTQVLSPENLIMHLCIHLSYSCFTGGIGNLVDISESIRCHDGSLNWDCIVGRSCKFGVSSFVYYPLCMAGEMMDANIPLYVVDKLRLALGLKSAEEQFSRMIFKRNILTPMHSSFIYSFAEFTNIRLCKTLLYTSGTRNRAREIASLWIQALNKSIHN